MSLLYDKPFAKGSLHNPFRTYSNFIYPKTIDEVFTWAMWFWDRNAKYRTAIRKVVAYFLSSFKVTQKIKGNDEVDSDAVAQFEELLSDTYSLMLLVERYGIEMASMGNVFVSSERIFSRQLLCPNKGCGWQMSLKKLHKGVDYKWNGKQFTGVCPQCHKEVIYSIKDTPSTDDAGRKVRFIFRDPQDMRLQYNRLTDTYKFYYQLPSQIKDSIVRGDSVYLEDSPKVFLEAATTDSLIEFPDDCFFAGRTTTISALDHLYKGWGVPLFMSSFDNFIRLQHLDKFNEAVTMDYIAPVRMISPAPQNLQAGVDPNRMPISGAQFKSFVQDSLKKVRENPTTWIVSPVPMQYNMLGGEAKQLAPMDLMEWYVTQILSDMGIPAEFRQTSFQQIGQTMGLRMFERQWINFSKGLDKFTQWAAKAVAEAHNIEQMSCSLDSTSFVEDDMNKQNLMGMMQGGLISKSGVLKRMGIDFEEDAKQRIQEQKREQEIAQEMQTEQQGMEMYQSVMPPAAGVGIGQANANIQKVQEEAAAAQQAAAGAPPEGAAPPAAPEAPAGGGGGGGGGLPFNQGNSQSAGVEQMFQEAQQKAQELFQMPPNQRRAELANLKHTNPPMHAAVTQLLRDQKQQIASDAVAQAQQPQ